MIIVFPRKIQYGIPLGIGIRIFSYISIDSFNVH